MAPSLTMVPKGMFKGSITILRRPNIEEVLEVGEKAFWFGTRRLRPLRSVCER